MSGKGRRHRRARDFTTGSLAFVLGAVLLSNTGCAGRSTLPDALNDREFASLIDALSEPSAGTFSLSDNLVSNELQFVENLRWLRPTGGAYIGVGPEQNFSYIARLRPAMAFIIDIRRDNHNLHLLYKALFELSSDRADFVSRLFSRPRPAGLAPAGSVQELFARFARVPHSPEQYGRTLSLIHERLLTTHALPLSESDLDSIARAFRAFFEDGPEIHFWGSRTVDSARPSYRQLMTAMDSTGENRSFLSTEEGFRFVKELQSKNLVVPVIGNFGEPGAIRRVGDYLRNHTDVVHAFYASNVGVYLNKQEKRVFCSNLAALPAAPRATFIESVGVRSLTSKLNACAPEAR